MEARGPSQALNLGGAPTAYGDSFIALDLMKGAEQWAYWANDRENVLDPATLSFDERGWLKALPIIDGVETSVYSNIFYGHIMPAGKFILEWEGEGQVDVYNDYTVIGPNKILIDFAPDYTSDDGGTQDDGISVVINSTDPSGTGDHIRNIKLYKAEHADLVAAGERFDPLWVNQIDDFRMLRTHDWQFTNFPKTEDWARNVFSADQAVWGLEGRGMPYELFVDLANETRSDLWVNIPHTASDDYMRAAASYLNDSLDPDLRLQVEFSNEYFTTIFDQYAYFVEGGEAAFGNAPFAPAQFYGAQAARVAEIFGAEFGAGSEQLRFVVTVDSNAFNSTEAETMLRAPASIAAGGESPLSMGVDVIATDGYLSWWTPDLGDEIYGWMGESDGGFGQARDFLIDQLENELLPSWQKGRALADKYGLEFQVYEGGTLLLNGSDYANADPDLTEFATRFTVSDEAAEVYEAMMAAWQTVGTGPFAWYADVGRPGPWGYYGHWDSVTYEPQPRADVIVDANRNIAPWWGDDDRPASFFVNGRYKSGTDATEKLAGTGYDDRIFGRDGNDRILGKSGADGIWAGEGHDRVYGDAGSDRIFGGDGRDMLRGGSEDDLLSGGNGKDVLKGGSGTDTLIGGSGLDQLWGGQGGDSFVFSDLSDGGDRIMDFAGQREQGDDRILLAASAFKGLGLGKLDPDAFQISSSATARNNDVRVIYDRDDHRVYFDADGSGQGAPVLIAIIDDGTLLSVSDFLIF